MSKTIHYADVYKLGSKLVRTSDIIEKGYVYQQCPAFTHKNERTFVGYSPIELVFSIERTSTGPLLSIKDNSMIQFIDIDDQHIVDKIIKQIPDINNLNSDMIKNQIKLSIVGRPNTGKSTLFNKLYGSKRSITSNIPGTTRDSIDYDITISNQMYNIVDTPGIRRRGKIDNFIEQVSVSKAIDYISESDVSILLIDSTEPATNQDSQIIKTILNSTAVSYTHLTLPTKA